MSLRAVFLWLVVVLAPLSALAAESPDKTVVTTVGPQIIDANGNTFSISSGAKITINGTDDASTANVIELAYVSHVLWQENSANNWYSYQGTPGSYGGPTTVSPLSPPSGGGGGGSPVVAPLTGTVTTGTWVVNQTFPVAGNPNGHSGVAWNYLLPSGYDPVNFSYPIVFVGAGNGQGMSNGSYPREGGSFIGAMESDNFKFNTVAFRTAHPAIIVALECDQTLDGSGATFNSNCGGYADAQNSSWMEQATNALAQAIFANNISGVNFNVDPTRHYTVGLSLSAIGYLAGLVDNNQINGPSGLNLWTAGIGMSTQLFRSGTPNSSVFARMASVPYVAICAPGDNPCNYDLPLWQSITGNTSYPVKSNYDSSGMAGIRAGTSQFYLINTNGGTAYGTFGCMNADGCDGTAMYAWLFQQSHGTLPTNTGHFTTANGKILQPNGSNFIGLGPNISENQTNFANDANAGPLTTLMPGVNFVRLAIYHGGSTSSPTAYASASSYQTIVDRLTKNGIVVEFEHHVETNGATGGGGQGVVPAPGSAWLNAENAFYADLATTFKNNPLVWFGTTNEPPSLSGLSQWQQSTYNAIRNTGNQNPILLEVWGSRASGHGGANLQSGMDQSVYTPMHNVIWDVHIYGYQVDNSTDQATNDNNVLAMAAAAQTITSGDPGKVPVMFAEWGPSTTGSSADANGQQTINAVIKATAFGNSPWHWGQQDCCNNLGDSGGTSLNAFGQQYAADVKANATKIGTVTAGESFALNGVGTVQANTVFTVSGTISGVTTAPSLQYQDNGGSWAALPSGASVSATAFSFAHPGMAVNAAATVAVRDANNTAISATGPPFIVAGPESADNTIVTTVGPVITDSHGSTFSITSGATISINGTVDTTTANVVELAYVSHVLWQKNAAGNWYNYLGSPGSYGPATTTSPITTTAPETLAINAIAQQTAGVSFTVSGTIANTTVAPTLQYQDNGGNWLPFPGAPGITRSEYDQPGGQGSVWNTPIGSGATWGAATDADTIDISRGWNGSAYTAGPVGVINSTANFGTPYWVGKATDSTYTLQTNNNGRSSSSLTDNGASLTATMHIPTGAISAGPYPGDNAIILADPVNFPHRQYEWGINKGPPGFQPGQGPFNGLSSGEWDATDSDQYGEDAETGLNGYNQGAGLITACDVTSTCNLQFPHIQHALRYSTDAHLLKSNATVAGGQVLKPDSWPQRLQDGQSGVNVYSGNLLAGTTLAIPSTTTMPGGLNTNCQAAFWNFQRYPQFFRDQAGGGYHLSVDQVADTSQFIADLRGCLPQLVALLRPMRNQHQTGQDFASFPKNGPGTRLDTGPPPLSGTSSGGTVTTTSFSFVHPGMAALGSNTIAVRDANATSVTATSAAFAVVGTGAETLSLDTIANQVAGGVFNVTGSISGLTAVPTLQYQDGTGTWTALPTGAVVSATSFSFPHPGMAATSSAQVSVRDAANQSVLAHSNTFSVAASSVETITVNPIPNQQANVGFTVNGSAINTPATLGLQYQDNGGAWNAFPAGSTINVTPGSTGTAAATFADEFDTLHITPLGGAPSGTVTKLLTFPTTDSFTTQDGAVWTILTATDKVQRNGVDANFTANVAKLALVNNADVYHANTTPSWYKWNGTGWDPSGDPTAGGVTGAWMDHYAFGGSEYTLTANNEAQYYGSNSTGRTPGFSPFSIVNGALRITADTVAHTVANPLGLPYNSGAFTSATEPNGGPAQGLWSGQYGYIAIKTTLPGGRGLWPGLVLYPQDGKAGEIDIVEALGDDKTRVYFTLHCSSGCSGQSLVDVSDYTVNSHEYAVNWQADFLTFYVDGVVAKDINGNDVKLVTPADMKKPYYIAIDFAVGGTGSWPGPPDSTTVFPAHMDMDYIRVFPTPTATGTSAGTATWSFPHPGMIAANSNTVTVRDAASTGITGASNAFATVLPESPNNTVVTTTGPAVIDATGESFTLNANQQVLVNGVIDPTASSVIALAYVNHTVWYENSGKLWFSKTVSTASWSSPGTLTSPLPPETLSVNAIGAQMVGTPFSATGTISSALVAPSLQYSVSGGPWTAFPAGGQITTTAWSLTVPAIGTAGTATLAIRDAGTPSISATSNSFTVAAAPVETLAIGTIADQAQNVAFRVTGTIANVSTIPTLQYAVNGGSWLALPSGSPASLVTQTSFAFTVPGIASTGTTTIAVRDAATLIQATSNSFQVGAVVGESLTLQPIANQLAATPFGITGAILNATNIPTLQYAISGGTWLPLPGGASVTLTGYTFTVPGLAIGQATISVRDANATSISVTSNSFQVAPAGTETLAMAAIASQPIGIPFSVSGTIQNVTAAPTLQYSDNGGNYQALPAGATVTTTSFSFIHPGLGATPSMTVSVRDAAHPAIIAAAPPFAIIARESANLTTVTTVGPQIIDSTGNAYTITPGHQVAVNGNPDPTTSNVIELAYVNRQVWYENANLQWWALSTTSTWGPTGGTLLGPLPSSKANIYLTSTRKLAVVTGFTVAVPGIVVNDTVVGGSFDTTVTATNGTVAMPGASGSGTSSMHAIGTLAAVNNSLANLQFTGKTIGTATIAITVTDPAKSRAAANVNIAVVRPAAVIPAGR